MDDFAPWEILHATFDAEPRARAFAPGTGGVYVVVWNDGRPIGHAWFDFKREPLEPAQAVARAWQLHPALPAGSANRAASEARQLRPRVSIVVCTRDRPEQLERALTAIGRLDPAADEVVVVDNASATDATARCVARFPGVRYVREGRPGLDRARNAGVKASSGAIIAFTDDDAEVHPAWLTGLLAGFQDPDVFAVTGVVLPAELQTEAQWLFETYWSFNKGYRPIVFDAAFVASAGKGAIPAWEVGAGANMAFRREAFDAVGMFDERLDVGAAGCSGDSEFWYRLLAEGRSCRYEPAAVVFHHHRRDLAGFRRQIFGYMRGHTAALLVQHERYGHAGNLRRLMLELPGMYAGRLRRILGGDRHPSYGTLREEILGCLSGVGYYLRHARLGRHFRGPAQLQRQSTRREFENRADFLAMLPKGTVGAELGVFKGEFSADILRVAQPRELHLVDSWWTEWGECYPDWGEYTDFGALGTRDCYEQTLRSVEAERGSTDVIVHVGDDVAYLESLADGALDWSYLDSSHGYEHTRRELDALRRKTKSNGVITGHDWQEDPAHLHHGVYRAVNEFCAAHGWEVVMLDNHLQWAIRRRP